MITRLLLCALLVPGVAVAQEPASSHTLTVSGTGTVQRSPDRATVRLAVESFASTAEAASAANAQTMRSVLEALQQSGVPEERIRTIAVQLTPEYEQARSTVQRQTSEDRLIGFRARNRVEVTVDEITRVGNVIDAAIGAGANRVDGLTFDLSDRDAARREALQRATVQAHAEAETVARALGRTLGPVLDASTTGTIPSPARPEMAARGAAQMDLAVPPPVQPGELQVRAVVTVVYRLEPPHDEL